MLDFLRRTAFLVTCEPGREHVNLYVIQPAAESRHGSIPPFQNCLSEAGFAIAIEPVVVANIWCAECRIACSVYAVTGDTELRLRLIEYDQSLDIIIESDANLNNRLGHFTYSWQR